MSKLDISNVVRVTLLSALRGLADINTSALALFTNDVPIAAGFGDYGVYKSPAAVAEDWGSTSETARLANAVFSQNPNIISGGGFLVVIPRNQSPTAKPATIISKNSVDLTRLTATDSTIRAAVSGGSAADLLIGEVDVSSLEAAEASLNSTAVAAAGLVFSLSGELTSAKVTLKTAVSSGTSSITISAASTGTDVSVILGIDGLSATGTDGPLPAIVFSDAAVDLTALTESDYEININEVDLTIGSIDSSTIEAAQESLNSVDVAAAGLSVTVSGTTTAAVVTFTTVATGPMATITVGTASVGTDIAAGLNLDGKEATGTNADPERVKDAIIRTAGSVDYFGIILDEKLTDADLLETANYVQALDKLLFVGSNITDDYESGGIFDLIKDAGLTHTRCLFHSRTESDAISFAAGYASRGLSVNFSGSNTASTMHLKEVIGLIADSGINQTELDKAGRAGVDVYADFGVPKVFTSGANEYFDQVYTRLAFKVRLQIAAFNYLAQTNSKIPQTEAGISGLKNAIRQVCVQFVTNGTFAPGEWTGATTFGDPETHRTNIKGFGYYIYSDPISQQSVADRAARKAPAIYIAAKDSGAIHSSDITVFIEE